MMSNEQPTDSLVARRSSLDGTSGGVEASSRADAAWDSPSQQVPFMSERASGAPVPLPRRAEWRWLLPTPPGVVFDHLILLGGPPELAGRLVECGIARRVSRELAAPRSADAVVMLKGMAVHPRAAASCLAPGGVLYCEIDRLQPGLRAASPARLRRSLSEAGLTVTGTYLARPSFTACREYLPLDVAGAIRWYLRTLHTPQHRGQQLRAATLRTLARIDVRLLSRFLPRYAVTAVATPVGSTSLPSAMLGIPGLPSRLTRPGLAPALFAPGDGFLSHLILFPFTRDGAEPEAVLKFPRSPERNNDIENGQAVLATVRGSLQGPVLGTLPEALGVYRAGGLAMSVEGYLPGAPLAASTALWASPARSKLADLEDTAAWLAEFHREGQLGRPTWGLAELARWVETPLTTYSELFGTTPAERRLFAAVREQARALVGTQVPIVWQHRGLHLHNITRAKHRINVLDWEYAEPALPLLDLVYFIWQWRRTVRPPGSAPGRLRAFRETFCEPDGVGWGAAAVRRVIRDYVSRVGLDERLVPIGVVLTWVFYALKHYDYTAKDRREGEDPRTGNQSVTFVGILADHVEALFAGVREREGAPGV
jgi:hypothetical protein